jgi:hypothetical protein
MRFAIQLASWLLWFPLKVLCINAMLKAGVRRYMLPFAYMVVTFLFAAVQVPLSLGFNRSSDPNVGPLYRRLHDWGEVANYTLILAVVLSFVSRATQRVDGRRVIRLAITGVGVLVVGISFWARYDSSMRTGIWITPWTRDVKFCAAILDLALWGLLVTARDRDPRLVLLTGGMGIMFAGEAIGAAIQSIAIPYKSYAIYYTGYSFQVLASALFLYVWWQTFRKEAAGELGGKSVGTGAGTD